MKKYIFILMLLGIVACLVQGNWPAAAGLGLVLFIWLAAETRARTRFRFLKGRGFKEAGFSLGANPAQLEIAWDGSCALFTTLDGAMSMRDAAGRELWKRPAEPGMLAILPLPGGSCYYATGDELAFCDATGRVIRRLSFLPPPFRQSYRIHLSRDASTLMLHTPWFLQFADPQLDGLGARIACEETGHYMKYAGLSPSGDRVFFAGAKLLEESTEARWGSWKRVEGAWAMDWSQAEEHYSNSHLRSASFSADGSALLLELHREGYEFRVLNLDGSLRLRKAGVEHPVLSPDAAFVAWDSAAEGLVLASARDGKKIWFHKSGETIRHKRVDESGGALALEGRHLRRLGPDGTMRWEAWFQTDPYRFAASEDGRVMALLYQDQGAMLKLPA